MLPIQLKIQEREWRNEKMNEESSLGRSNYFWMIIDFLPTTGPPIYQRILKDVQPASSLLHEAPTGDTQFCVPFRRPSVLPGYFIGGAIGAGLVAFVVGLWFVFKRGKKKESQ